MQSWEKLLWEFFTDYNFQLVHYFLITNGKQPNKPLLSETSTSLLYVNLIKVALSYDDDDDDDDDDNFSLNR